MRVGKSQIVIVSAVLATLAMGGGVTAAELAAGGQARAHRSMPVAVPSATTPVATPVAVEMDGGESS